MALERVDHVHGRDGLALGVLAIGHSIADHVLQEDLEHGPGLFVDEAGDPLHTTTSGQTADGRLGDALKQTSFTPVRQVLNKIFVSVSQKLSKYHHIPPEKAEAYLDVVTKDLAMALGASFSQTFASLATT